ncbi:hypothetical protein AB0873_29150 [Micromonospora sp. NPDC047707]|uniref:hypothetical protein n=1 Tax=Micromonospora sp. NPDC047707 TaxID=3154498 RepID=UPI003454580D
MDTGQGRMHDTTAARVEGIGALLDAYPQVEVLVVAGYQGLAKDHPDQVTAPPLKLRPGAPPVRQHAWPGIRPHDHLISDPHHGSPQSPRNCARDR